MKNTNTLKFYSSNEPARGFLGDEGQSPSFNRLHQGVLQVGKISFLKNKNNFYFSWNVTQSRYKYYFCAEFLEGGERNNIFQSYFMEK